MSFIEKNTGIKYLNEATCKCGNVEIRPTCRNTITCYDCRQKKRKEANTRNALLRKLANKKQESQ